MQTRSDTSMPPVWERAAAHLGLTTSAARAGTRTVCIATSRDDNPKAMVLVFEPGCDQARLAIKTALTPGAVPSLVREAHALRTVSDRDPGRIGGLVPQVLELCSQWPGAMLITTAQPGHPLSTDYHRHGHTSRPDRVAADLGLAAQVLTRMAALPSSATSGAAPVSGIGPWAGQVRVAAADRPSARTALAELAARVGAPRRHGIVHGDFWAGNLLHHQQRPTGLVDWEHATADGDPLADWVRFALAYSLYLDRHTRSGHRVRGHPGLTGGSWGSGIAYAVDGSGWFPELLRDFVGRGLSLTGRPSGRWREALLAGVAEVAVAADHEGFAQSHLELLESLT
ncbi:MAG: phosphotransferase [Ornithinimicrobium sp.]